MPAFPSVDTIVTASYECKQEKHLYLLLTICRHGLEKHQSLANFIRSVVVGAGLMYGPQNALDRMAHTCKYLWSSHITQFIESGRPKDSLIIYKKFYDNVLPLNKSTYIELLKTCIELNDLEAGSNIHFDINKIPLLKDDLIISNKLIDFYAKCGSIFKTEEAFNNLMYRDVVSWNSLIAGYIKHGLGNEALACLDAMQLDGFSPNAITLVHCMKACVIIKDENKGRQVHNETIMKAFLGKDHFVGNTSVDMYAKLGFMEDAQEVFDKLLTHDVITWTSLIAGYVEEQGDVAIDCFEQMKLEGVSPNAHTFVCMLKACSNTKYLDMGGDIHHEIVKDGLLEHNILVGNALIDMYAKCGLPTKALEVFKKLPTPDITSWNSLIRAYVNDAQDGEALNCFRKMQLKGVTSDAITLVYSLRASASLCAIDMGITIHVEVARKGFLPKDIVIGNAIIDLYAKCGFVERAHEVLDSLPNQTVVSWTTLIAEYVRLDLAEDALDCFQQMQDNRLSANSVTFACCLKACGLLEEVETGRSLHSDLETNGLIEDDLSIGNEVIGMYARCGFFMDARNVLYRISIRDVLSWNALLVGYVLHHHDIGALKCFQEMQIDGVYPNDLTLALALKISGNVGNMDSGKGLHDMIVKMGLFENDQFICNSLVDTYARLGMFEEAWNIFHMLPIQDVAAWASLIEGYTNHNHPEEALCCFEQMMGEGVSPSTSILMYTLKVCGSVKDVNRGISIHSEIARTNLAKEDLGLGNALVSMYTQCGSLIKAQEVFDKLSARNVATWNALITAYANQNEGQIALDYFSKMQQEGFIPNAVTFVCALNACADCGVVGKMIDIHCEIARRGFVNANEAIGNALTNTYAQCGLLEKAQEVLANMLGRGLIAWTALIGGYTKAELDEEGLVFYEQMKVEGFLPNAATYISILKACGNQGNQYQGRQIHTQIALQGLLMSDPSVGNALVKMYAKCGCFTVAREALNNLPFRDSASWNALIMEYSSCGLSEDVLSSFEQMQLEGVHPNAVTFACSLQACACMGTSEKGQTIHTQILNMGDVIGVDSMVCNSLLYMYVRCGSIPKAMELIEHENHNAATWCQLVARCIKHVLNENMHDFGQTMIKEPVSDFVDLFSVLDNLCYDGHSDFQHIYTDIGASNLLLKSLSTLSAICDVSSKRELFSKRVYNRYTSKNVVVWTALMTDLIKHGQIEDALNCYDRMQLEGIVLDSTAFVHCLIACGNIGALQKGCEIHAEISRMGLLGRDLVVGNALVNMYSKCGSLQTAQDVFDQLSGDVITWTSLIDGHVQCGDMNKAFSIFEKMRREGTNPDAVIFLKILDACSRANLLDKAQLYFDVMQNQYGVSPSIEHYTCILDLLGRAGNMQELEAAMKKMPLQPDHVVWRTVLGAYKRYGQSNLGGNAPQFSLLQGVGKDGSGCL